MRAVKSIAVYAFLASLVLAADLPRASELPKLNAADRFWIESGETRTGDVYLFSGETRIDGVQQGDLIAWTAAARIGGEVDGDVFAGTQSLDISGRITDSVRVFAHATTISGEIDGDLIILGGMLVIHEDAHITGDLLACTGMATVNGTVDGAVTITGGEIEIGGTLGKNAHVEADALTLTSGARILGDLTHSSREFEQEDGAHVAGEIIYEEKPKEDHDDGISVFSVIWWCWGTVSAMLIGLLSVALFRRMVPAITHTIGGETMMGTLIGFGAFLVVPAASILALLFLPLGLMGLAIFFVGVYLAKMPVAVWLGGRLLSPFGGRTPSPYLAIVLGVLILRLLFLIPYVGWLVWLVAVWLGLGAMILATRSRLQQRQPQPATP
jgi:cytoskeletal protein CcmA (bactofilin family)